MTTFKNCDTHMQINTELKKRSPEWFCSWNQCVVFITLLFSPNNHISLEINQLSNHCKSLLHTCFFNLLRTRTEIVYFRTLANYLENKGPFHKVLNGTETETKFYFKTWNWCLLSKQLNTGYDLYHIYLKNKSIKSIE